jgi:hypothetical protein
MGAVHPDLCRGAAYASLIRRITACASFGVATAVRDEPACASTIGCSSSCDGDAANVAVAQSAQAVPMATMVRFGAMRNIMTVSLTERR